VSTTREGGCNCGAVRYRLESEPLFVHCCHCRWCQRESGSAFALNALIETDRCSVLGGEVATREIPTQSGQGQRVSSCAACGTLLWSHYAYAGIGDAVRFIRVASLDDPNALPPDIHIFTQSKQAWLSLDSATPQSAEFYSAGELWPQASLDRRAALFAAKKAGG